MFSADGFVLILEKLFWPPGTFSVPFLVFTAQRGRKKGRMKEDKRAEYSASVVEVLAKIEFGDDSLFSI